MKTPRYAAFRKLARRKEPKRLTGGQANQVYLANIEKDGPKRREAAKVLALTASRGVSSKWLVIIIDASQRKRFPFCMKKFLIRA
jgi:hypothetical protein